MKAALCTSEPSFNHVAYPIRPSTTKAIGIELDLIKNKKNS
jgi:hypothetical protein